MFRRIAVGDVMTRNFVGVKTSTNLQQCAKEMVKQRVNSLLIIEEKKLKGILTARDLLWTITKKPNLDLRELKAIDIASKKLAVIKPSADIGQALNKMRNHGFRRLPVMSKGKLLGIITLKDLFRVDPNILSQAGELEIIREEAEKLKKLAQPEEWDAEGLCVECNTFAPLLRVENRLLCPDCREELY